MVLSPFTLLCRHHHQASSGLCLCEGSFPFYFYLSLFGLFEEPHIWNRPWWLAYHFVLNARLAFWKGRGHTCTQYSLKTIYCSSRPSAVGSDDFELVMEEKEGISERLASSLGAFPSNQLCLGSVWSLSSPCLLLPLGLISWTNQAVFLLVTSGNLQLWIPSGILYAPLQWVGEGEFFRDMELGKECKDGFLRSCALGSVHFSPNSFICISKRNWGITALSMFGCKTVYWKHLGEHLLLLSFCFSFLLHRFHLLKASKEGYATSSVTL